MEVAYALADSLGYTPEAVRNVKEEKAAQNGAFRDRVFLEKVITAE